MNTSPEPPAKALNENKREPRFSVFTLMVFALFVGIGCGVFFGEYCQVLSILGDAYVGLLQMTVLPYIVFSVIGNIGRLSLKQSKRLAIAGLLIMGGLWAVGMVAVWLLTFALPLWKTGSFFSTSLVEPVSEMDFLSLFIPSNPFQALSRNYAPAVVLFCLFFGVALIAQKSKQTVLDIFQTFNETLSRVNTYIVRLSPIGIFAIAASAAGTMTIEEFGRLQAYFFIYIGGVLLLTLWVLPMIVTSLTPIRYRELIETSRTAMITVFVIGSVFVVIPMLVNSITTLTERYRSEGDSAGGSQTTVLPEFIIPLAYPFPHLGKIVTLIFVPFAAWFYGQPMAQSDYPLFALMGLFLSFGKVTTTMPFLLEMQQLPVDIFQLFLMSSVIAGRFNDLLGAAHLLTFTALTTCAMTGLLKVKRLRLFWGVVVTVVVGSVMIVSMQSVLNIAFKKSFSRDQILSQMNLLNQQVPATILSQGVPNPIPLKPGLTRSERINQTGTVRIGFHPDNLPFSYYNARGELVGFDIDMAHRLARDAGQKIEFVPFTFPTLYEQLSDDHFDLAMSGIVSKPSLARYAQPSVSYINVTMALVVRDHEKHRFMNIDTFRHRKSIKIGVEINSAFVKKVRELLPEATIVELWSESQFFEGPPEYMDALLTSAEVGSAWTLVHPQYSVVTPFQRHIKIPLVYLVALGEEQSEDYLKHWIELKKQDGTIQELYDYWILGRGAEVKKPRWSVIRDLLHWVD